MNRLLFNLKLSKIFFLIILVMNLAISVKVGIVIKPEVIDIIVILIWFYGLLSSLGYVKKQVSSDDEEVIVYETAVPIVQIFFARLAQGLFHIFIIKKINWPFFLVLIVLDLIYTLFLYLDKANYYYANYKNEE